MASWFLPGLSQVYAGRPWAGLVLAAVIVLRMVVGLSTPRHPLRLLAAGGSLETCFDHATVDVGMQQTAQTPWRDDNGDGVPDDADDCPGTPDWITCDDDPTNDGLYATVFYDPTGAAESLRREVLGTVAEIPQIDVYFLIDATPTLADEIDALQAELQTIVDAVRAEFGDARFGIGITAGLGSDSATLVRVFAASSIAFLASAGPSAISHTYPSSGSPHPLTSSPVRMPSTK